MPTQILKPVRGKVARITKLNSCGAVVLGPKSQLVTEGIITVEGTVELEEAQEYKLKGAHDRFIYNSRGNPLIRWVSPTINFGQVDPESYLLTTGSPVEFNDAAVPEAVGFRIRENVFANFALELWTDLEGMACINGLPAYGYLLLPWVKDANPGNWTWQNDTITFPLQGARTERASGWGVGPYNVLNKLTAPLGPSPLLTAIDSKDHMLLQLTTLAPPSPTVGAIALP